MKETDPDDYEFCCSTCDQVITSEARTCPHCGADTSEVVESSEEVTPEIVWFRVFFFRWDKNIHEGTRSRTKQPSSRLVFLRGSSLLSGRNRSR